MKTFIALTFISILNTGIYSIQIPSISGGTINMSSYEGKKMIIVNIATGSQHANQLVDLQELYETHQDSLVVIGVPSNTFGAEPRTNDEIKQYCDSVGVTFPIAERSIIVSEQAHSLFKWLTSQSLNGVFSSEIKSDFQKYIINSKGELVGVFPAAASTNHPGILHAINN